MEEEVPPVTLEPAEWTPVGPTALPPADAVAIADELAAARRSLVVTSYVGRNPAAVDELSGHPAQRRLTPPTRSRSVASTRADASALPTLPLIPAMQTEIFIGPGQRRPPGSRSPYLRAARRRRPAPKRSTAW